jgi:D-beta-D-heptose 7-phosphate kinase / D-beta-D-heptose 1-phosphate adenosyltransferase
MHGAGGVYMELTEKFSDVRVLCVGDVMLDRFISGEVKRISPESPVPVLSVTGRQSFPGGAANVARNVAALGGRCTLVSVIGRDPVGHELQNAIHAIEGLTCEFSVSHDRPTSEKTRFVAHGQHMLRTDAEVAQSIDVETEAAILKCIEKLAAGHDVMVLSDYAKGLLTDTVVRGAITIAQAHQLPVVVDPKSVNLARYAGATVITPNSKEVHDATGIDPTDEDAGAEAAGAAILRDSGVQNVLLTRAHRGMTLMGKDSNASHIRASAREVFDVVGAGDTVIATLALAIGAKLALTDAARLANLAAGIVVGKRGTATVTQTELADELARVDGGTLGALRSKIMSLEEVLHLAHTWRKNGLKVGFTNGCFDILHVGHLSILSFARQHSGKLIVAVNSDASVRRLKEPGRPINGEHDRAMVLAALSVVDAVVVFDEDTPLEMIERINPEVLVKGGDYTVDTIVGAQHVLSRGGAVLTCPLVPGKSTTRVLSLVREARANS